MPHASTILTCDGPDAPHAFDNVPLQPRNGMLDARCPICRGHGQWNVELELASFRCQRAICPRCLGAGWIETGDDPVMVPDIELSPEGHAQWVTRAIPQVDVSQEDRSDAPLILPG